MKICLVIARFEELQVRGVDKVFKKQRYSKGQDNRETREIVNIGRIDRSVDEWKVQ